MKHIKLTKGKMALVDDADFEWLSQWKWHLQEGDRTDYAIRNIDGRKTELMHRLILGLHPGDGRQADHRDGNGLNNQGSNLRICTRMQNQQSSKKRVGTSKYKGVHWSRHAYKWRSQIRINKKVTYLGYFKSESDAARAYDAAAIEYHNEFALTNKMLGLI